MKTQVEKSNYEFTRYSHPDRWVSYYFQLKEMFQYGPESVLEIGVGDRVFGSYIKNNTNIQYTSIDIAEDLGADIVGSVTDLPFADKAFTAVCAFEVLEHLPFTQFEIALKELGRVSSKVVLLSLPHFGPPIKFLLKLPFLPEVKFASKFPYLKKHHFNGEHYWEIGKKGYPLRNICDSLKKFFILKKHFVPFDNQYHHFFILEPKK